MRCPLCDLEMDAVFSWSTKKNCWDVRMGCGRCKKIWSGKLEETYDGGAESKDDSVRGDG